MMSFRIKDLGELNFFLGLEVARSHAGINIFQKKYTLDLLKDNGFISCKPTSTPMVPSLKFSKQDGSFAIGVNAHRQLIRKLLYLTNTRPDICFAVQ